MEKNRVSSIIKLMVFLLILLAGAAYIIWSGGSRRAVAGIREPIQEDAEGSTNMSAAGYSVDVKYLASYDIEGLVVHRKKYGGSGIGASLAPVDAAIAWGSVAENNRKINFHWKQSGRWYYWRVYDISELAPVGREADVNRQSANNHLVPADEIVRKKVKKIRRGDHIRIKGYLVDIHAEKPDGSYFNWRSSTSREDTGDGACELIYVTDIEWL